MQQGDVQLFNTVDGGEISITAGVVAMSGGLDTAAYLSLFGGNDEDDGSANNPLGFWGNLTETEPEKKYVSQTQFLLRSIPAITGNLRRIEEAAASDLQWFLDAKIASSVTVVASIPAVNRVTLTVDIVADGERSEFEYTENWPGTL